MANILYMAISKDGFIAGPHDETPWSDESWSSFQEFVKSCDVVLLGRRSFTIMKDQDELIDGSRYIVVTHDRNLDTGNYEKRVIDSPRDIPDVGKLGIIGGGELNGSLAKLGVIDEIILDIEDMLLHEGIKLWGSYAITPRLQKVSSKNLGKSVTQDHYKVLGWE